MKNDPAENFIDSITEHAAAKHMQDLRNENSSGRQLNSSKSKGTPLSAFDKDDFRTHLRNTLSDPETQYFVDESNGRMTFFNNANRTRIVFNPAQFETDGHAGTLMRDYLKYGDRDFLKSLRVATENMGYAPEVRSVSDGKWIDHLEKYRPQLENIPARQWGKGDLRTDMSRAAQNVTAEPLPALNYNAPNAPRDIDHTAMLQQKNPPNGILSQVFDSTKKHGGKITGFTIGTVVAGKQLLDGATPAEAAEDFYETAAPYGEAQLYAARGDAVAATQSAVVETVSNAAFVACAIPGGAVGGAGGTAVLPGVGTVVGAGTGAMTAGTVCAVGTGIATEYAIDNAGRIIPAVKDVASYGAEQTVSGTYDLADTVTRGADHVRDKMNGDLALMKEVYEGIPTVDISQTADITEIYDSPDIAAMVTAKSREIYHADKMGDPDGATAYHTEQAQEWKDNFETAFDAAKDTGTLPAVMAFITDQQATLNDHAVRDMQRNIANVNTPAASEQLPGNYPQQQNIGGMKL